MDLWGISLSFLQESQESLPNDICQETITIGFDSESYAALWKNLYQDVRERAWSHLPRHVTRDLEGVVLHDCDILFSMGHGPQDIYLKSDGIVLHNCLPGGFTYDFCNVVNTALARKLVRAGYILISASGVNIGAATALIVGPSGWGKTLTAFQLSLYGGSVLGTEVCILSKCGSIVNGSRGFHFQESRNFPSSVKQTAQRLRENGQASALRIFVVKSHSAAVAAETRVLPISYARHLLAASSWPQVSGGWFVHQHTMPIPDPSSEMTRRHYQDIFGALDLSQVVWIEGNVDEVCNIIRTTK